jgi:hypothetical protein
MNWRTSCVNCAADSGRGLQSESLTGHWLSRGLSWFSSDSPDNYRDIMLIMPRPLPSQFPPFDGTEYAVIRRNIGM